MPAIRYEAAALRVVARERCPTGAQDMKPWGGGLWTQGRQLLCRAQHGGYVELGFSVPKAGRYRLRVLGTAGPDYGVIRAAIDGRLVGRAFDLYSGRVSPAGSLELGTLEIPAGRHRLRIAAVGKNPASQGFIFGLDAIDLLRPLSLGERAG
jgi:hypothetical protein